MLIEENEEKTPRAMPLSPKGLKTKPRKSVRRESPRDMLGYDSGIEALYEKEEEAIEAREEEEEEATTKVEEEESDEMPPLGHQSNFPTQLPKTN